MVYLVCRVAQYLDWTTVMVQNGKVQNEKVPNETAPNEKVQI